MTSWSSGWAQGRHPDRAHSARRVEAVLGELMHICAEGRSASNCREHETGHVACTPLILEESLTQVWFVFEEHRWQPQWLDIWFPNSRTVAWKAWRPSHKSWLASGPYRT
jgi:hypothetical protein